MPEKSSKQPVLELGAGPHPRPETHIILDIVDYKPVDYVCDIGEDKWPLSDESVSRIVGDEILEHIPRDRIDHVFREADRVLESGGTIRFQFPHPGTDNAVNDPTHRDLGGFTPYIASYFTETPPGLAYWGDLDWEVDSYAVISFPSIVRHSLRPSVTIRRGDVSYELTKIPFVSAYTIFKAIKN